MIRIAVLLFLSSLIFTACHKSTAPNNPPEIPSNIYPLNAAENVMQAGEIYLEWECSDTDGDELKYNVYICRLGWTDFYLVGEHQTETVCQGFQWTWEYHEMYAWKVVAYDSQGDSTSSPVWYFIG